jgi:hypothetical protein
MIVKREKITATPVYRKKDSKEPGPANHKLMETNQQIRDAKAMILAKFGKAA